MSIGRQLSYKPRNKYTIWTDRSVSTEDDFAAGSPPLRCQSTITGATASPIRCQSVCQCVSIFDQYNANPSPIGQSRTNSSVRCQSWNNPPIPDQYANPRPTCQTINNPPIQCQSLINLPVHDHRPTQPSRTICQSVTNPSIQCQSLASLRPTPRSSNINPASIRC